MAVRGGQEEIAMATKLRARGGGCASTEGSTSVDNCNDDIFGVSSLFLLSLIWVCVSIISLSGYHFYPFSFLLFPSRIYFSIADCFFLLRIFRDCSVPNLSTTRPIQKSVSRQDSQYSEDMDNLMNTKLVSGSTPASDGQPNPVPNHIVAPGFGSALQLANSGTHGSLVTLDSYGSIAHHRTNSVLRLPHPDYTALDVPIFPSTNAILQSKCRGNMCRCSSIIIHFLFHFRFIFTTLFYLPR